MPAEQERERERSMATRRELKRKSFFVDEATLHRARRALRVRTDAEAVRLSLERVVEMDEFWRFMKRTRGRLAPGSFDRP